jgi:hypothetical protein
MRLNHGESFNQEVIHRKDWQPPEFYFYCCASKASNLIQSGEVLLFLLAVAGWCLIFGGIVCSHGRISGSISIHDRVADWRYLW